MLQEISKVFEGSSKKANIRGWVYRARAGSNNAFFTLRDGTGVIQCTVEKEKVSESIWKDANEIYSEGSVVEVEGTVKEDARAPDGKEIAVSKMNVIFKGETFPVKDGQTTAYLLDNRHLWIRSQKLISILKFKHALMKSCRNFLDAQDFLEIQPPMTTKSACEGGSTVFEVKYFDTTAYLSQSGQLYSEAVIAGHPLVYCFAPSFRAEPSRTPRHLTEFWQLEPEMAWYDFDKNIKLQDALVENFCHELAKTQKDILNKFKRDPKELLAIKAPFERMTYKEAIEQLQSKGLKIKYGDGIGLDEEKVLVEEYTQPVHLIKKPKTQRPFYMKLNPDDEKTVLDNDLLAPEGIGEITGGSERIWEYDELVKRLKEDKMPLEPFQWYLDLRKYGSVPHAGFGMGSERVVRWLLKLNSIRDAIPFPRSMNRLSP